MTQRVFSPKCIKCRQRAMALTAIHYKTARDYDGASYTIDIPAFEVPRCANCGEVSFDEVAVAEIDRAFRRAADLLTAEQIRSGRLFFGYDQQQLADLLGIAVSTLVRLENNAQVPERSLNRFMKAFFSLPQLQGYLAQLSGQPAAPAEVESQLSF